MGARFNRLLLTGASGRLGARLRVGLAPLTQTLRLADRVPVVDLKPHEEAAIFALDDMEAALAAARDCDAIVHFGGAPLEAPWEEILASNIRGGYNIFEAARRSGVVRVVFASSVHAIGYHTLEAHIDADAPHRPDSLYGLSKCFVEDLGRLYWDKFGIESAHLRIFSSTAQPTERRMLWSWISFDDVTRLVVDSLTAPRVGHTVCFGLSDNKLKPVDDRLAGHLGFRPQDTAEACRAQVEAAKPVEDPRAPATACLGGWFVDLGHPDDPPKA